MDNYWCHSAFTSLPPSTSSSSLPVSSALITVDTPRAPTLDSDSADTSTGTPTTSPDAGDGVGVGVDSSDPSAIGNGDTVASPPASLHYQIMRLLDHFTQLHRDHTRYLRSIRTHPHYRRYQTQYMQKVRVKQRMLLR
ncbi:hypothetical protein EON65_28545, partial [archaeon]